MSRKIKVAVCVQDREARTALMLAVADSETFDVVAVAPARDLFIPLAAAVYPEMIIIDEAAAAGSPAQLAHMITHGRRLVQVVLTASPDTVPADGASSLPLKLLRRKDHPGRNEVQTALFAAATPIITAKRTYLSEELQVQVSSLRKLAKESQVRKQVMAMASWPLDLILLVDDGNSLRRLAGIFASILTLPVPVILVIDNEDHDDYGEIGRAAPELSQMLTASTNVRAMEGLYVVPPGHQVWVSGENVCVSAGEVNADVLLASMAWLKSGGLSVLLSNALPERAARLAGVASDGGLVAALDPAHCEQPEAGHAAEKWPVPPLLLAPDELRWTLEFALPRKG